MRAMLDERSGPDGDDARCEATLDGSEDRRCCRPRGHDGLHRWQAPDGSTRFEWAESFPAAGDVGTGAIAELEVVIDQVDAGGVGAGAIAELEVVTRHAGGDIGTAAVAELRARGPRRLSRRGRRRHAPPSASFAGLRGAPWSSASGARLGHPERGGSAARAPALRCLGAERLL